MAHGTYDLDSPTRTGAPASPVPAHGIGASRERLERRAIEHDELSSLIAHDLKNPLSSVRFGAELLLHDATIPPRVRYLAEQIMASTDSALALIAGYLEPPVPAPELEFSLLPLDTELRAAIARAAPLAAAAAIELRVLRLDRFDACLAGPALAAGLDRLLESMLQRAPRGSAVSVALERVPPDRAVVTLIGSAPPPSREAEQAQLRQFALMRSRHEGAEAGDPLTRARLHLARTGAELYRVTNAPGSVYRAEFVAAP